MGIPAYALRAMHLINSTESEKNASYWINLVLCHYGPVCRFKQRYKRCHHSASFPRNQLNRYRYCSSGRLPKSWRTVIKCLGAETAENHDSPNLDRTGDCGRWWKPTGFWSARSSGTSGRRLAFQFRGPPRTGGSAKWVTSLEYQPSNPRLHRNRRRSGWSRLSHINTGQLRTGQGSSSQTSPDFAFSSVTKDLECWENLEKPTWTPAQNAVWSFPDPWWFGDVWAAEKSVKCASWHQRSTMLPTKTSWRTTGICYPVSRTRSRMKRSTLSNKILHRHMLPSRPRAGSNRKMCPPWTGRQIRQA